MKRVWQEALLVGVVGAALAFAANAFSPSRRRIDLRIDHFPATGGQLSTVTPDAQQSGPATNGMPSVGALAERFQKEGLQLADSNQVSQFFHDPRRQQDLVVFIDARKDSEYQAGHIPGAYQFDIFHQDDYLPTVWPICKSAEQIMFYCGGGECDLSENAAKYLRDNLNLPKEKVFVYGGGMIEWNANRMPVEIGARNSGNVTNGVPSKQD